MSNPNAKNELAAHPNVSPFRVKDRPNRVGTGYVPRVQAWCYRCASEHPWSDACRLAGVPVDSAGSTRAESRG